MANFDTERGRLRVAIGEAAHEWRKSQHLTQARIADDLGIVCTSISQFEIGNASSSVILAWYLDHGMQWSSVTTAFMRRYHRRIDWGAVYG